MILELLLLPRWQRMRNQPAAVSFRTRLVQVNPTTRGTCATPNVNCFFHVRLILQKFITLFCQEQSLLTTHMLLPASNSHQTPHQGSPPVVLPVWRWVFYPHHRRGLMHRQQHYPVPYPVRVRTFLATLLVAAAERQCSNEYRILAPLQANRRKPTQKLVEVSLRGYCSLCFQHIHRYTGCCCRGSRACSMLHYTITRRWRRKQHKTLAPKESRNRGSLCVTDCMTPLIPSCM